MTKRILLAALTLTIAIAPLAASAGEVNNRLENETDRIDQGIASGQITRGEDAHLQAQQNRIDAARERDLRRNDGHLTAAEHRNLNARENNLSRNIYFDKHNLRRQPGAPRI